MTKVERIQYQAALAITGAWQGSSRTKLYDELGWETLSDRRKCRRAIQVHKIINKSTLVGTFVVPLMIFFVNQIDTGIVSSLMPLLLGIFLWKSSNTKKFLLSVFLKIIFYL